MHGATTNSNYSNMHGATIKKSNVYLTTTN
jgi:hypothetical protein